MDCPSSACASRKGPESSFEHAIATPIGSSISCAVFHLLLKNAQHLSLLTAFDSSGSMSTSTSTSEATSSSTLTGAATNPSAPNAEVKTDRTKPVCALVIGMAGSGKTTLMQCLGNVYAEKEDEVEREKAYFINLDPAVSSTEELPYFAHIDIRDTVKYKEVMKQYGLGPNGGIVTALNLFATRFDQVLGFCEKRSASNALDFIFLDTPGQIEVFTWSASGSIITESLANAFPTCILYVVDTPRNLSPVTFMSNMMYACRYVSKT